MWENLANILKAINKLRFGIIIILFISTLIYWFKNDISQKLSSEKINNDISNNVLINKMLNDLLVKYNADRAYIFQFHNTIKFYDGTHKNHQSCTFEVVNLGVSRVSTQLQNIPVSLFPQFLQDIMFNKMHYQNIDDMEETTTRLELKSQGIKSLFIAPYFKEGQFVAYIGLDYVKDTMKTKINYLQFQGYTNQIGNLLTQ
jgi:hypothetical protein